MKLSVCVETVYADRRLPQRVEALRRHGVNSFELWGIENQSHKEVSETVGAYRCPLTLFCGNRHNSLVDPDQRPALLTELATNLRAARELGCPGVTILSDAVDDRGIPIPLAKRFSRQQKLESLHDGLVAAVAVAEEAGIRLFVEPLNSIVDHPGYTLDRSQDAFDIVGAIGRESLKVLFDVYHIQMMEGDVSRSMEANMAWIGHVHVADVPGRHEPGTGQVDFARIARLLLRNDYAGCIGLECFPVADSDQAIHQFVRVFEPYMAVG